MLPQPLGKLQYWMVDAQPNGDVRLQIRQEDHLTMVDMTPSQAKEIARRLVDQAQWAKVQKATLGGKS